MREIVLDIILPRSCVGCGKEGKYICEKCDLFLSEAPTLFSVGDLKRHVCNQVTHNVLLEELVSAWEYDGLMKEIIFKIKYDGMFDAINELVEKALKQKPSSGYMCNLVTHILEETVITFVPMFEKKERDRGFNQAEIMARKVGEMTGVKVISLLEKIKDTPSQTELDKTERIANVKNSFRGRACNLVTRIDNVLLVDDVWTSGATMRECARVLKRSGVKKVFGFTLARTV